MKKNIVSILALVCAAAALAVSVYTCISLNHLVSVQNEQIEALLAAAEETSPPESSAASSISYSNLLVDSWSCEGNTLTITGGYVQTQLTGGAAPEASLSLRQGKSILDSHILKLVPGEGSGSYEAELTDISFSLKGMTENSSLELWLDVTAEGTAGSVCGAEWYQENGELLLIAG